MALIKLCFSVSLLLLLLTCPLWQHSQAVPVMSKVLVKDSCVIHAQKLLQEITKTLSQLDLFKGIICTKQSVEMNTKTNTASACAPMGSHCSGIAQLEFNEDLCLVPEDLRHYYKFLSAQPDPSGALSRTVLPSLRELMEDCFMLSLPADQASEASTDHQGNFNKRLSLCKVLKGFHVRAITINRAISYMNSGEHTK
ncbi:interleukin-12 subunit alpha-like [Halichoeres trimaculatus]|uniref:interleukin-12 subunit alpha-like n=1 Tax=Halichoeres trimaculatus TaxID=147232 RepID=UPI003D9F7E5A